MRKTLKKNPLKKAPAKKSTTTTKETIKTKQSPTKTKQSPVKTKQSPVKTEKRNTTPVKSNAFVTCDFTFLKSALNQRDLQSQSIFSEFESFYSSYLSKLEHFDRNMLELFSKCFVLAYFNIRPQKSDMVINSAINNSKLSKKSSGKISPGVFKNGIVVCKEHIKNKEKKEESEVEEIKENDEYVVNLYSVVSGRVKQ